MIQSRRCSCQNLTSVYCELTGFWSQTKARIHQQFLQELVITSVSKTAHRLAPPTGQLHQHFLSKFLSLHYKYNSENIQTSVTSFTRRSGSRRMSPGSSWPDHLCWSWYLSCYWTSWTWALWSMTAIGRHLLRSGSSTRMTVGQKSRSPVHKSCEAFRLWLSSTVCEALRRSSPWILNQILWAEVRFRLHFPSTAVNPTIFPQDTKTPPP